MKMCFQVTHSEFFKSLLMSRHVVPRRRRSQCGSRECRQPAPPPRGWLEMTGGKQIGQGKWLWLKLGLNSLRYIYIYYHTLYYINIIYYIYKPVIWCIIMLYYVIDIFQTSICTTFYYHLFGHRSNIWRSLELFGQAAGWHMILSDSDGGS